MTKSRNFHKGKSVQGESLPISTPGIANRNIGPRYRYPMAFCPLCQKMTYQFDIGYQFDGLAKGGQGNFTRCRECCTLIPRGIIRFGRKLP